MNARKLTIRCLEWLPFAPRIFDLYHDDHPLLLLGSRASPHALLALAWDEVAASSFLGSALPEGGEGEGLPMTLGTVGLLSYDAYQPGRKNPGAPQRFFRIRRSLVLDQEAQKLWLCEEEDADSARWKIPLPWELPPCGAEAPDLSWRTSWSDERYEEAVRQVVAEIREGRFYQLNLLRYWRAAGRDGAAIPRAHWRRQLDRWAGPYAAHLDFGDCALVSFSPEQFFSLRRPSRGAPCLIETRPIKGTRAVHPDPAIDRTLQRELQEHPKDRAELSMIVDLMRNDLLRVCRPGSVRVLDPGSLQSFPNVHHLVARISGEVRTDIRWGEMLSALCPGGSITGAPKREVMDAIASYEGRDRAYFMGNLLYCDRYNGRCDSSILIRTAQRMPGAAWEFAAGSGLVIHSDPGEERAEVGAKAQVILGSAPSSEGRALLPADN